ncbi:sulfatase-like hydrolase/transferase [Bacteroides xylanisolvens]|nr:sulfatase-like hydrolase/transferase [Bacteroides xylanisolvens]
MLTSILSCSKPSEEIVINHPKEVRSTPNILFVIADDQSFPHCSAYGNSFVKTPAFDYIASQGCLFQNAYVTSPGSSPSRASILSGMYPWQIKEAGTHCSYFPKDIVCYTDILTANGYNVGYLGKGVGTRRL